LDPLGLSLDLWCVHTQIPEVAGLAAACPRATIILNHLGAPLNVGPYAGREKEVFEVWSKAITELARRPNVFLKLGGLGSDLAVSLGTHIGDESSASLCEKWRPYVETCIAAFGAERCMFESNFPPDSATCTYGALWNTFKRVIAAYSETEKSALFSGTARKIYRLD
jgi:predicted TIM-barrel fold metal-dependent hydrolase